MQESNRGAKNQNQTINLYCPSLSKLTTLVLPRDDDHSKIDIGAIARIFGLDPSTVKLNGHFISRGVDYVASSVTWKSLISFFTARRLPTGIGGGGWCRGQLLSSALVVDGKLFSKKSRPKRLHEPAENGVNNNLYHHQYQEVDVGVEHYSNRDCNISMKKQRVQESEAGCGRGGSETMNGLIGLKRKHHLETSYDPLKKLKEMFTNNDNDCSGKENHAASAAELPEGGAKRTREEDDGEATLAWGSSCKRVRQPWEDVSCRSIGRIDGIPSGNTEAHG